MLLLGEDGKNIQLIMLHVRLAFDNNLIKCTCRAYSANVFAYWLVHDLVLKVVAQTP